MKKKLTYETFDTHDEAESFIRREKIKRSKPSWSDQWHCWVVWYKG